MTDAPERIATWCWNGKTNAGQWSDNLTDHYAPVVEYVRADLVEAMEAENQRLRAVLAWYGEQARLARLIHSEGDAGRRNLEADGGSRARAALRSTEASRG